MLFCEVLSTKILAAILCISPPEQDNIFDADYVTDRSEKFVVAEFIREKLMRHLTDELPYDLTVETRFGANEL
jgi:GTP-binding protein Era